MKSPLSIGAAFVVCFVLLFSNGFAAPSPMFEQQEKNVVTQAEKAPGIEKHIMTKEDYCDKNAKDNLEISKALQQLGNCGPSVNYSDSYHYYYQKCLQGNAVDIKPRQAFLAKCISNNCDSYAKTAVAQNEKRIATGCPKGDNPDWWSSDYQYHYKWCIQGKNALGVESYNTQREQYLNNCKKTSPPPDPITVTKSDIVTLRKENDPKATFADLPFSGSIPSIKNAKLLSVTNNTQVKMTFKDKFFTGGAKCFPGQNTKILFTLWPGQTHSFNKPSLMAGKWFHVCVPMNSLITTPDKLQLDYSYEVTTP